jgi:hypothetical protein
MIGANKLLIGTMEESQPQKATIFKNLVTIELICKE